MKSATIPDWSDALRATPQRFADNGCSSPLRKLHGALYSTETLHAIGIAARLHDCGFGPFRLPGSGWEEYARKGWNVAYSQCLCDQGCPHVARVHYAGLMLGSALPWNSAWHEMKRLGWHTWQDYVAATDATVAAFVEAHHKRMTLALSI
jgi:hypothetical protein